MRIVEFFGGKRHRFLIAGLVLVVVCFALAGRVYAGNDDTARNGRLITFHDRGNERVILTHARSVRDAVKDAAMTVAPEDIVEPRLDTQLVATSYEVNIYRARPVIVIDGVIKQKIMESEDQEHEQ